MHTIAYISGVSGEILWILGGKRNNFTDLSDGQATNFAYQHDARFLSVNTITLFDNGAEDNHLVSEYSRGMKILLDFENMTAKLLASYVNPNKIHGVSQGGMQVLSKGDVLVGYGNSAAWTQFDGEGKVLCDVHYGPMSGFGGGNIQSYRVQKFRWVGNPSTKPDVRVIEDQTSNKTMVYVSWNGATEVVQWILQGVEENEKGLKSWTDVQVVDRNGFETSFDLQIKLRYLRVIGVDKDENSLGTSGVMTSNNKVVSTKPTPIRSQIQDTNIHTGIIYPVPPPRRNQTFIPPNLPVLRTYC